jgi:hypothetical protein
MGITTPRPPSRVERWAFWCTYQYWRSQFPHHTPYVIHHWVEIEINNKHHLWPTMTLENTSTPLSLSHLASSTSTLNTGYCLLDKNSRNSTKSEFLLNCYNSTNTSRIRFRIVLHLSEPKTFLSSLPLWSLKTEEALDRDSHISHLSLTPETETRANDILSVTL